MRGAGSGKILAEALSDMRRASIVIIQWLRSVPLEEPVDFARRAAALAMRSCHAVDDLVEETGLRALRPMRWLDATRSFRPRRTLLLELVDMPG